MYGANGAALGLLCAWLVDDRLAARRSDERDNDLLGVYVIAIALVLLSLAEEAANIGGRGRRRAGRRAARADAAALHAQERVLGPGRRLVSPPCSRTSRWRPPCARCRIPSASRAPSALLAVLAPAAAARRSRTRSSEGGWFGEAHESQVRSALAEADDAGCATERVETLLAEETRMGMLVGVAVGWELARELDSSRPTTTRRLSMDIRFLGHACFELTRGRHARPRSTRS